MWRWHQTHNCQKRLPKTVYRKFSGDYACNPNFLLGACLFPITLGYWWVHRDALGPKRAALLAGLLGLGYFCHLLSALLTALGLVILSVVTPGPQRFTRCRWTAVSLMPLLPLGFIYYRLGQAAGPTQLRWRAFPRHPWSLHGWLPYLQRDNPFAILLTNPLPLVTWENWWFHLLYPPLWLAIGGLALILGTLLAHRHQTKPSLRTYRGWIVLACCLAVGWVLAPEGARGHGALIPIRFLPLALIAIVPVVLVGSRHVWGWVGAGALAVAVMMQSAVIWEVALSTDRLASAFIGAIPSAGMGRRIGTLAIDRPPAIGPRKSTILHRHLDSLLGIGTGNIIWHNYEAKQYYFPVQLRHPSEREITQAFSRFERIRSKAPDIEHTIDQWARLLADHHDKIDVLVVWGADPRVDQINRQWYGPEPVFQQDDLRVFYHH
jgi:hypothetical protein